MRTRKKTYNIEISFALPENVIIDERRIELAKKHLFMALEIIINKALEHKSQQKTSEKYKEELDVRINF